MWVLADYEGKRFAAEEALFSSFYICLELMGVCLPHSQRLRDIWQTLTHTTIIFFPFQNDSASKNNTVVDSLTEKRQSGVEFKIWLYVI